MILNCRNSRLDEIELTPAEYRLLAALASNELVLYSQIIKFVYRCKDARNFRINLSELKHRLSKKMKQSINIETRSDIGMILHTKIEII